MLPNRQTELVQSKRKNKQQQKTARPHGSCRVYKNEPCDLFLELSFKNAAEQV